MLVAPLAFALVLAGDAVDDRIARGQAALDALDYDVAADELTAAAVDPAATPAQRFRASVLAGTANVIVGRAAIARVQFRAVLLEKPDFELAPDAPEKVTTFFREVKNGMPPPAPPPAAPKPPPTPPATTTTTSLAWIGASAGGALVVAGVGFAGGSELALGDPTLSRGGRATWQIAGRIALAVAASGVIIGAVGGVLAVAP